MNLNASLVIILLTFHQKRKQCQVARLVSDCLQPGLVSILVQLVTMFKYVSTIRLISSRWFPLGLPSLVIGPPI